MSRERGDSAPQRESEENVVTLYGVRGLYLSIFQKKQWEGAREDEAKYEASWITEEDSKFYDRNLHAIEDAIKYVGDTDKAVRGKTGKRGFIEPLAFGADTGLSVDDFGKDMFVVKSKKSNKRPRIIDADGELIAEDDLVGSMNQQVKSGDYFDVILRLYGYDNKSVGINCEIMLIRFRKSGEALGGGREYGGDDFEAPDDDFERSNGGSSRSSRGGSGRGDSDRGGRGRDDRNERSDRDRNERSNRDRDDRDNEGSGRRGERGSRNDGDRHEDDERGGRGSDRNERDDRGSRSSRRGRDDNDDGDNDRAAGRSRRDDSGDESDNRSSRRGRDRDPDRDDNNEDGRDGGERRSRGRR